MRIGYVRVSTKDQRDDLQIHALERERCDRIFIDHGVSGTIASRPELDKMLELVREGDEVVSYSLSRMGRNTKNTLALLEDLEARGIVYRSITENFSTAGAMGKAIISLIAVINSLEADLLSERTRAGMDAAKRRGAKIGRKPSLTAKQHTAVREQFDSKEWTIPEIAGNFNTSVSTIWRSLRTTASDHELIGVN